MLLDVRAKASSHHEADVGRKDQDTAPFLFYLHQLHAIILPY